MDIRETMNTENLSNSKPLAVAPQTPQATPKVTGPQAEVIRGMFAEIAGRYDLANSIMSFGIHHLWRRFLVRESGAKRGQKVLDCATGTGDLAIEFKRAVGSEGEVFGTDFCKEMLASAPEKAARRGLNIHFETADVMQLPYPDSTFDISSISFGIRNVENPVRALSELARVTKPGGAVMVLEFGQPSIPGFQQIYSFYSRHLLPKLGGLITGRGNAYEYLQNSSARFPCGVAFAKLMKETGRYANVEYKPVSFGIAYVYKGTVQ
jgi:demethylmenaquinone methyltransferase/2-methoxy-6-polyprenyl-1,4-benzoquinol methylase